MACYRPLEAYFFSPVDGIPDRAIQYPSGKPRPFFGERAQNMLADYGSGHEIVPLPCRKCVGCRMTHAQHWSTRCVHEARYYSKTSFLTLTYNTPHLPFNNSINKRDFQLFMKRLRIRLLREYSITELRYLACGEYGERNGRPHYHAVLFGWDFPDKVPAERSSAGDPLFDSPFLQSVWSDDNGEPIGRVRIGELTVKSANYVARYTLKKEAGPESVRAYMATGRTPPFLLISKGLGKRWITEFMGDVYPSDSVFDEESGRLLPVPRYYDKQLAKLDPQAYELLKRERVAKQRNPQDQTPERLAVREEVHNRRVKRLRRSYEETGRVDQGREGQGVPRPGHGQDA